MLKSYNFGRKDEINSVSASLLQNVKNEHVTVTGCAITERPDNETGENVAVGLLVTKEHGTMTTISKTAIRGIDLLTDYMTEEGLTECEIIVKAGRSNSGREFLTIEIC